MIRILIIEKPGYFDLVVHWIAVSTKAGVFGSPFDVLENCLNPCRFCSYIIRASCACVRLCVVCNLRDLLLVMWKGFGWLGGWLRLCHGAHGSERKPLLRAIRLLSESSDVQRKLT